MKMNWFRVYNEARNDAKLRTLSDGQFRVWFNLLCLASEQEDRGTLAEYPTDLLSIEVAGGDDMVLAGALHQLERLRVITVKRDVTPCNAEDERDSVTSVTVAFVHFVERQYDKPSDHPSAVKERVTKHRSVSNKEGETPSNAMKRDETHREDKRRVDKIREDNKDVPTPAPAFIDFESFWAEFKTYYPAREGRREGIDSAAKDFARDILKPAEWGDVIKATRNYAGEEFPVDPIRFFKSREYPNGKWRGWVNAPAASNGSGKARGSPSPYNPPLDAAKYQEGGRYGHLFNTPKKDDVA